MVVLRTVGDRQQQLVCLLPAAAGRTELVGLGPRQLLGSAFNLTTYAKGPLSLGHIFHDYLGIWTMQIR